MKMSLIPLAAVIIALVATSAGVLALTGGGSIRSDEGIDPNECNLVHNIDACDQDDLDRLGDLEGGNGDKSSNGNVTGEIAWEEAVQLIRNCEVTSVFQTHSLAVEITLKDGTNRSTTEPSIDLVLQEAQQASASCESPINLITE